jgi:hypothetical protein
MAALVVPSRFCGPPRSGNGGWTAGALASLLLGDGDGDGGGDGDAVSVRLHRPPPLETALDVATSLDDGRRTAVATLGRDVVATAAEVDGSALPVAVPAVDAETAQAAESRFRGSEDHPFPTCFVCGPQRAPGDGLRLRPGLLLWRDDATACTWTPDASLDGGDGTVPAPVVWAALDCPGGWSVDLAGRPMVLGTITARVRRRPRVGEACVVTGAALGAQGRRSLTATTLYGDGGEELARAAHIWVTVDPAAFAAL